MVKPCLTTFVLRPRHLLLTLACLLVAVNGSGCNHHRRASLRPVFVSPAPAAPCNTPGCATENVIPGPAASAPAGASSSAVESGLPSVVEPSASSLGAPAEPAPSSAAPQERIPSAVPGPPSSGAGSSRLN